MPSNNLFHCAMHYKSQVTQHQENVCNACGCEERKLMWVRIVFRKRSKVLHQRYQGIHFVCHSILLYIRTVADFQIGWRAILWSKMVIFKRAFHKLRVLSHLCPPQKFWQLMRALKWGTIQGYSSRGMKTARGKS